MFGSNQPGAAGLSHSLNGDQRGRSIEVGVADGLCRTGVSCLQVFPALSAAVKTHARRHGNAPGVCVKMRKGGARLKPRPPADLVAALKIGRKLLAAHELPLASGLWN